MPVEDSHELNLPPTDGNLNPNAVYDIPIRDIFADEEFNSRGFIDPLDVVDLAHDIKEKGLVQPVLVQPWDLVPEKKYRLVCGYRRYKATRVNESQTIRAIVRLGIGDLDARVLNLAENLQRKNLNIKQEAEAIRHFREAGLTEQEAANRLKMSRAWVTVRWMLLDLPEDIVAEVNAGMLTQHQVRAVHRLKDNPALQYELVRKIKDTKIKGTGQKAVTQAINKVVVKNAKKLRTSEEIFSIQSTVQELFGNGLTTKALAWAGGAIDDFTFHKFLHNFAIERGKFYAIPENIGKSRSNPEDALETLGKPLAHQEVEIGSKG